MHALTSSRGRRARIGFGRPLMPSGSRPIAPARGVLLGLVLGGAGWLAFAGLLELVF